MTSLPVVVISACLTGESCRYNGESCLSEELLHGIRGRVTLMPLCPEHQSGMGTPREPMDLYMTEEGIRLVTVNTEVDLTIQLKSWIDGIKSKLDQSDIAGFILKSDSPSCGIGTARLHHNGKLHRNGTGLFAAYIKQHFPHLPAVQEKDLDSNREIDSYIDSLSVPGSSTGGCMC